METSKWATGSMMREKATALKLKSMEKRKKASAIKAFILASVSLLTKMVTHMTANTLINLHNNLIKKMMMMKKKNKLIN